MKRNDFISKVDEKVKLIRIEKGYTQEKMAEVLGISKKTLVQIEKERGSLGWSTAIAVCVIFKDSEILELTFGGDTEDLIRYLAFENDDASYTPTLGGKVWWKDIQSKNGFIIQQNIISNHYRILDDKNRRVSYSFDFNYINKRFNELVN